MSFDKYYDLLYKDGKLNREFVTYLATIHIKNSLSKKDIVTNEAINDLGCNFVTRFNKLFDNITSPLGFINDDILDFYNYTKPHLDNILDDAAQSIIKETKLVPVNKLKNIDSKTMTWLANKPGATFREKLAQVNKVSSTVKRYSMNIQANQVVYSYFKKLYRNLSYKLEVIKNNPTLFGDYNTRQIKDFKSELNKLDYKFKTVYEEVTPKDYSKANNTLLGNTDYRSVWNSYIKLKSKSIMLEDVFDSYKNELFNVLILRLMNSYQYIEDIAKDNFSNYILYSMDEDLKTITFQNEDEFTLIVSTYNIKNGKSSIIESQQFNFDFKLIDEEVDSVGGLFFRVSINGNDIGAYSADLLGCKTFINDVIIKLKLKEESKVVKAEQQYNPELISINSFDNTVYGAKEICPQLIADSIKFLPNNLYLANSNVITLLDKNNDDYHALLKVIAKNTSDKPDFSIYDIKDTYDEFSSMKLRSTFAATINNSYPVWRSILAAESIKDKNVRYIIDLCGDELSISELGYKNDKFIHKGAIEIPLYVTKFTEYDFYDEYISKFENKYNVNYPESVKMDFIKSGKLASMFVTKNQILSLIMTDNLEVYYISYDAEIFCEVSEKISSLIASLKEKYENAYVLLPNYLTGISDSIFNKDLIVGARKISNYVKNKEIAWYEVLPDLSLEVIRNGMYDELTLVKNQECENIIGKKLSISAQDTFTLTKGQNNYILPLNKSFVGEQNDFYVAKLEDKSFPLDEDVTVKLRIEYSFGNENSYHLFFESVNSAIFKKIEAKWEKEIPSNLLLYPSIKKTKYQDDDCPKVLHSIEHEMRILDKLRKGDSFYKINPSSQVRDIKYMTNDYGRLINYSDEYKQKANELVEKYELNKSLKLIRKVMIAKGKYNNFDLEIIEEAIATFEPKNKYFDRTTKNVYVNLDNCYGRHIAIYNDAYVNNQMLQQFAVAVSKENYLYEEKIHQLISSAANIIACNPYRFKDLADEHPVFVMSIIKYIDKILDDASNLDLSKFSDISTNKPKQRVLRNLGYTIRQSLEIIISYLFCREYISFDSLKPGNKLSNHLIKSIKKLNYYSLFIKNNWPSDVKPPKLSTKYNMKYENKDDALFNMWNEAFCVILYLSGDNRANYIKMGDTENDR